MKDYLDMDKYKRRGAYHWTNFAEKPGNREYVLELLDRFTSIEPNTGQSILDIGCGDGLWTHLMQEKGYNVSGIDANSVAISLAQEKGVKNVSVSDVNTYNGEHDVAYLFDVFEHIPTPERAITNLNKVIRNKIYVLNPLFESPKYHFALYQTTDLQELFQECWTLTYEHVYEDNPDKRKSLLRFERFPVV